MTEQATIDDFLKVKIAVGKVLEAEEFPEARKPAYKLTIDFGEFGIKKSSAQITDFYTLEDLKGKLVLGVVNFPPRQIGPFMSECLTLGVADDQDRIILVEPDQDAPLGSLLC